MSPPNRACPKFSLAIIAGGQSSRMGRDKAFLELGGQTLIERVIAAGAEFRTVRDHTDHQQAG